MKVISVFLFITTLACVAEGRTRWPPDAKKQVCFDKITGRPLFAPGGWCLNFCVDGNCSTMCDINTCACDSGAKAEDVHNCTVITPYHHYVQEYKELHEDVYHTTNWSSFVKRSDYSSNRSRRFRTVSSRLG